MKITSVLAAITALTLTSFAFADDDYREFKGHTGPTRAGLYTPDGQTIVSCSGWPAGDGTVRVWDVKTGKELRKMTGHKQNIDSMAISPDGKKVYSGGGSAEGIVRAWEVDTGKALFTFDKHKGQNISCLLVSPDGKAVASGGSDKKLILWDASNGNVIQEFKGHTDLVRCLAFSKDGKTLCSGSWDGSVKVWDVATAKEKLTFKPKTKWVYGLAVMPGDKKLIVGCDEIVMWDLEKNESIKKYTGHSGATCLSLSGDGKKLITGWYDGKVTLWDVETGVVNGEFQAHAGHCHGLCFSPDGKWFTTAGGGDYVNNKEVKGTDFTLRLWKVEE